MGEKTGGNLQSRHLLHLGQMLVLQAEAVDVGGVQGRSPVRRLVFRNHLPAAAGVAGERVAGHRIVGGQDPHGHQGGGGRQKAGGVTAGVGHPFGVPDPLPLAGQQLGEAVDPAGGGAVGGGGVHHPGVLVFDERHRLHGGGVGQAQEHQIGRVQETFALGGVLALVRVNAQQLDVVPGSQALVDLQAGGALLAVNV